MPTPNQAAIGYAPADDHAADTIRHYCRSRGLDVAALHHEAAGGQTALKVAFAYLREHPGTRLIVAGLPTSTRRDQRRLEAITVAASLIDAQLDILDTEVEVAA